MRISDWSSDVCSSDLFEIKLGTKVTGATVKGGKASLTVEPAKGGAAETIEADAVLVAIGRKPNTDGLALDKAGLATNARGQIETDHDFATTVSGIWAIGDVVPGPMLAHKAEDEGVAVAENIRSEEHTSELQSLMRTSY